MLTLQIANILFGIAGRDCRLRHEHESAYEAFLKQYAVTTPNISVEVVIGRFPDISGAKKLFSSGSSWFLLSEGADYYLVFDPLSTHNDPLLIAMFDPSTKTVTIFCNEQLAEREGGELFIPNPLRYPLDQLLIMYYLAGKGGAILHAAGAVIKNRGYLFPGRSGAGKSTLTRQFIAKQRDEVLSDDRIVVRMIDGTFTGFGTPWPGEAAMAANKSVSLAGVFFIAHGNENHIRDLSRKEAFERLLPVTSIPWYDKEMTEKLLVFCEDMVSHIPAYELHFIPSDEIIDVLENFIEN